MDFNTELEQRLTEVKQNISTFRKKAFGKWGKYLHEVGTASELTNMQIAFLTLLSDKFKEDIYPTIYQEVYNAFDYYYEDETRKINVKVQGLDIQDIESSEWSIYFEDDEEDYLVIVHFYEWKYTDFTTVG
jgi:hypothetical protein